MEPFLGPIGMIDFSGIWWIVVEVESGLGARPVELDWVCDIRDLCEFVGLDDNAAISFGMLYEPEDPECGKYRLKTVDLQ